jgi:hypothetical protein
MNPSSPTPAQPAPLAPASPRPVPKRTSRRPSVVPRQPSYPTVPKTASGKSIVSGLAQNPVTGGDGSVDEAAPVGTGPLAPLDGDTTPSKGAGNNALPEETSCVLQGISLRVPRGQLVGICGAVGAGKSSLLSTVLGQLALRTGSVAVLPHVAYVAQQAWILSDTLKNNILFGQVGVVLPCTVAYAN